MPRLLYVLFQKFALYGIVSVNGESGKSTVKSGGGSGGMLYVKTDSFFGRGSLTSNGGTGYSGTSYGKHLFTQV